MHQRNSSSVDVQIHDRCVRYLSDELYEPLPSVGLVVRPVEQLQPGLTEQNAHTLTIAHPECVGRGSYNSIWRVGHLGDVPVVLRVNASPAAALQEIAEAGLITAVVESYEPPPANGWRVRPAHIYGVVDVPTAFGLEAPSGKWEDAPTLSKATTATGVQFDAVKALVMDEAPGISLSAYLKQMKRHERVPLENVKDLMRGLGSWIEAGRQQGVAHTDLKTANIMATKNEITLVDHTPIALSDLKRLADPQGVVIVKNTMGYTDMHGMEKAATAWEQGLIDEREYEQRIVASQMRAAAIIALECLNGGKHPVADHPHVERRGYMGIVEPETYEHALQLAEARYKAHAHEVASLITALRACIRRTPILSSQWDWVGGEQKRSEK